MAAHASQLAGPPLPAPALKHALFSAARFACDLLVWCPDSGPLQQRLVTALFPLLLDCTTENLADLVTLSLERRVGTGETEQFLSSVYGLVLEHGYPILCSRAATQPHHASGSIPQEILRYLDLMLDKPVGRAALHAFFSGGAGEPRLTEVLLSLAGPAPCPDYAQRVLRFFTKLFSLAERGGAGEALGSGPGALCRQLADLADTPRPRLEAWLRYLVSGMFAAEGSQEEETLQDNRGLLQSLTEHIVGEAGGVPAQVVNP